MEMECACKGSVAVAELEGHGDGMCILRFYSGGRARRTWRWNVYVKVL